MYSLILSSMTSFEYGQVWTGGFTDHIKARARAVGSGNFAVRIVMLAKKWE